MTDMPRLFDELVTATTAMMIALDEHHQETFDFTDGRLHRTADEVKNLLNVIHLRREGRTLFNTPLPFPLV